jgi:biopolymer transport protein ExbD
MRVRIARRKPVDPSESGALNDLAFLLIIYFIVIAGFNVNLGFLLNLPGKDSVRVVQTQDLAKFRLDAAGSLSVDGAAADFAAAEAGLRRRIAERPNLTMILYIDPACPWQYVVEAVAMAQRSRVENFSFKKDGGS